MFNGDRGRGRRSPPNMSGAMAAGSIRSPARPSVLDDAAHRCSHWHKRAWAAQYHTDGRQMEVPSGSDGADERRAGGRGPSGYLHGSALQLRGAGPCSLTAGVYHVPQAKHGSRTIRHRRMPACAMLPAPGGQEPLVVIRMALHSRVARRPRAFNGRVSSPSPSPPPLSRGARPSPPKQRRADAGARRPGALMGYPHGIALRVAKATPPHAPGGQEPSRLSAWHCTHGSRGDCGGDWRPAAVGVDRHCTPTGCASLHRSSLTSLILSYSAPRSPLGPAALSSWGDTMAGRTRGCQVAQATAFRPKRRGQSG